MNFKRLGPLQKQMLQFIKNQHSFRFHVQRDADSRRVADSLEKRGIISLDRAYECWCVNINRSQMIAIRRLI